jgi:hypothetical protein
MIYEQRRFVNTAIDFSWHCCVLAQGEETGAWKTASPVDSALPPL